MFADLVNLAVQQHSGLIVTVSLELALSVVRTSSCVASSAAAPLAMACLWCDPAGVEQAQPVAGLPALAFVAGSVVADLFKTCCTAVYCTDRESVLLL